MYSILKLEEIHHFPYPSPFQKCKVETSRNLYWDPHLLRNSVGQVSYLPGRFLTRPLLRHVARVGKPRCFSPLEIDLHGQKRLPPGGNSQNLAIRVHHPALPAKIRLRAEAIG
jgi:hypothetical protein